MLDLYSKIVFSVIALALSVIAWNVSGSNYANAAFHKGCGSSINPCHIKSDILTVRIEAPSWGIPVSVKEIPSR
jgi:hypothetical protein